MLAASDAWLVHGYALATVGAACGIGHLAGRVVLKHGLATQDASRRPQAPLLAMLVRMFVAVPLLLAAIFAAGALLGNLGEDASPRHAKFVTALWAAAGYAVMVAFEARSASTAYHRRENADGPSHPRPDREP
jgi:hypothetical protein